MLAGSGDTVVATAAGAGHVYMVEAGAKPCACIVAIITFSCCLQMCSVLAGGGDTIVATAA
jgi:hypothetical protein